MFCKLDVNSKIKGSGVHIIAQNLARQHCFEFLWELNCRKALERAVSDVSGPEPGTPSASDGSCPSLCGALCRLSQGCETGPFDLAWRFHYKCRLQNWLCVPRPTDHCGEGIWAARKLFPHLLSWSTQLVQEIVEEITTASLCVPLLLCFSLRSVVLEDRI